MRSVVRWMRRWAALGLALGMPVTAASAHGGSARTAARAWAQEAEFFDDPVFDPYYFGKAVAVSGPWAAASEPMGYPDSAVQLYRRVDGAWRRDARLVRPGAESSFSFGTALALSGRTLAVAAPGEGNGVGAVYVFQHDPLRGSWTQQARLALEVGGTGFGESLALVDDSLVVGAPLDGGGGAAHVFVRHRGTWARTARLVGRDSGQGDLFGRSVAFDGTTIVVGAPRHRGDPAEPAPDLRGAAYVFMGAGARWSEESELGTPSPLGNHLLGAAVAVSGDTVVVGSDVYAGGAHAYRRTTAGWIEESDLLEAENEAPFGLGHAIAASGDRIVLGCPWAYRGGLFAAGEVYVLQRGRDGSWSSFTILDTDDPPGELEMFGHSVALDGRTLLVGTPQDGEMGPETGAVYLYRLR